MHNKHPEKEKKINSPAWHVVLQSTSTTLCSSRKDNFSIRIHTKKGRTVLIGHIQLLFLHLRLLNSERQRTCFVAILTNPHTNVLDLLQCLIEHFHQGIILRRAIPHLATFYSPLRRLGELFSVFGIVRRITAHTTVRGIAISATVGIRRAGCLWEHRRS